MSKIKTIKILCINGLHRMKIIFTIHWFCSQYLIQLPYRIYISDGHIRLQLPTRGCSKILDHSQSSYSILLESPRWILFREMIHRNALVQSKWKSLVRIPPSYQWFHIPHIVLQNPSRNIFLERIKLEIQEEILPQVSDNKVHNILGHSFFRRIWNMFKFIILFS